jgi:hypothetical protein
MALNQLVSLGEDVWGHAPYIWIEFFYESERRGADMVYRLQAEISPLTGSSYFGYPIYIDVTLNGTKFSTWTVKDALPSQWDSTIVGSGTYSISNKISGTVPVAFRVYSGSGSSREETFSYTLPVEPMPSTVSASDGTLSTTLYLDVTRYDTNYTHTITYTCTGNDGTTSGTVCTKSTSDRVAWDNANGNVSGHAVVNKSGTYVNATFTITTYDGETVIGTNSKTIKMAIHDNVRPDVALLVDDDAGYLATYGALIQGWSRLKLTADPDLAYASPIETYLFTVGGVVYRESDATLVVTDAIQGKNTLRVTTKVTDYRGRSSDEIGKDVAVLPYSNPAVTVTAYRCNSSGQEDAEGAYMRVGFTATISDLNGKNSASYYIYTGASGAITGEGTSYMSDVIPCDITNNYAVEVVVSDNLSSTTRSVVIPIAFTLMDFYNTGKGVALGKVATRDGFDCAMDAYFTGKVTVGSRLLVDLIYPVGSIYMSTNNVSPQTFFGGTWERIQDRFLLAAGSTYAAGGTGGSATHTLTISEMPTHAHILKVATSTSAASDAAMRPNGATAYSSQLVESATDNVLDAGGGKAHNNMPPYLTVYMWKRSK